MEPARRRGVFSAVHSGLRRDQHQRLVVESRDEMQRKLTRAFSSVFAYSVLGCFTEVDVKYLARGLFVAHARWTMTGARMPAGMPAPDAGIMTLVLEKQGDGRWLIAEFQNTLGKPEHPFPAASAVGGL